jgi:hypothetical protein
MMSDPLFPLLLILRYMHILGAIGLMGSTIFMRLALAPVVGNMEPEARASFHEQIRSRWAKYVALWAALLLLSGIANLALAGRYAYKPLLGMDHGYHMIVGIKFLLALPIFFIASMLMGRTQAAKRFQSHARTWMTINLCLALIMVLIGGMLKFVVRVPKRETMQSTSSSVEPSIHSSPHGVRLPVTGSCRSMNWTPSSSIRT